MGDGVDDHVEPLAIGQPQGHLDRGLLLDVDGDVSGELEGEIDLLAVAMTRSTPPAREPRIQRYPITERHARTR